MRVDATSTQNLLSSLANLSSNETSIASQLSSGVRLTKLSDDPTAVAQSARLADGIARSDAFVASANTVNNRLQAADTALSSVVTNLTSAIATATSAVGGVTSGSSTADQVTQLTSVRQTLLSLANSSYGGSYLFGGTSTAQPFTQAADGSVAYTGNNASSSLQLASSGQQVNTSVDGSKVFTAAGASVFGALNDLITNLTNGTASSSNSAALIGALRDSLTNVSSQRAAMNVAQNQITDESDYVSAQETNLKAQQSALVAADPASLATQLSTAETQRSALLSTMAIVEKGSLFDYLK